MSCVEAPSTTLPAPAVSSNGLVVAVLSLIGVGVARLTRRRRVH
jgi:hypothetical protein